MTTDEMIEKMNKAYDSNSCVIKFAVRKSSDELAEGQELSNSCDSSDDGDDEELNGTSGTMIDYSRYGETLDNSKAVENAIESNSIYFGKHQCIIAGYDEGYGQDDNEILLSNAKVVCIIK